VVPHTDLAVQLQALYAIPHSQLQVRLLCIMLFMLFVMSLY
jgi:hypothetical protein